MAVRNREMIRVSWALNLSRVHLYPKIHIKGKLASYNDTKLGALLTTRGFTLGFGIYRQSNPMAQVSSVAIIITLEITLAHDTTVYMARYVTGDRTV